MSSIPDRYRFTDDQKALLTRSIEPLEERHGEPVFIEFGMSQAFEAARIGFVGHAVSAHQEYFMQVARTVRQKIVPWWQRLFG